MAMDIDMEREMLETYAPRGRRQEDQIANLRLAQERARELKSFAIPNQPGFFWVRGHEVHVLDGKVANCDCPSWRFRATCKHAERVAMRLGLNGLR